MYNSLNIDIVYDIIVYYDVFDIWFFIFVWCCDFVILYLGYIFQNGYKGCYCLSGV